LLENIHESPIQFVKGNAQEVRPIEVDVHYLILFAIRGRYAGISGTTNFFFVIGLVPAFASLAFRLALLMSGPDPI